MKYGFAIALISGLAIADDLEELYGLEEPDIPTAKSWTASASLWRVAEDSLNASLALSYRETLEFSTVSLRLVPALAAIQYGTSDSLQSLEASLGLSLLWKGLSLNATPWYSHPIQVEQDDYGYQFTTTFGHELWTDSWLSLGASSGWSALDAYNASLRISLGHLWYGQSLWHGPSVSYEVPFEFSSESQKGRGKKPLQISVSEPSVLISYRMGWDSKGGFWGIWSESGVAIADLSGTAIPWGSAEISIHW